MNEHIKQQFLNGRLVLLFGAGASADCKTRSGELVPSSSKLAGLLANAMGETLSDESLSEVYAAARDILGFQVDGIFDTHFRNTQPSDELLELAKYPFTRIYTLNIDDSFERALTIKNKDYKLIQRDDPECDADQFFSRLDLIKLNGDINRKDKGYIFSAQEYAVGSTKDYFWYQQLARDFFRYTFVFVGSSLNEPLFKHHIENYRSKIEGGSNPKSYILVPALTSIQKSSLSSYNIVHLEGTLSDFSAWLKEQFAEIPTPNDILQNVRPEQAGFGEQQTLFSEVIAVNKSHLVISPVTTSNMQLGSIRDFYRGFKPTWGDILDGVPVWLSKVDVFFNEIILQEEKPGRLFLIEGPAGCGKSTALKQIALKLSDQYGSHVFFIDENYSELSKLVRYLDTKIGGKYYLVIERLANLSRSLSEIINTTKHAIFIGAENKRIWASRVSEHLSDRVTNQLDLSEISDADAELILKKLKEHGSWTRLSKMSPKNRKLELLKKSKNQLLIGMLEVTYGAGFNEIIRNEFNDIKEPEEKYLVLLAGLATLKRVQANENTLIKALEFLELVPNLPGIVKSLSGILNYNNGKVTTRHRVYIEKIFDQYIDVSEIQKVIRAYLSSFVNYSFPFARNMSKSDFEVYKFLVNARSLKNLLKNNQTLILQLYQEFEKSFELEGLFLMQYGLALRSFGQQDEALNKLLVAEQAFPESPHIRHALAQQRIIFASSMDSQAEALKHFNLAEDVLTELYKANPLLNVGDTDKYPIITLSEGHVKILLKFNMLNEARNKAAYYHNLISSESSIANDPFVKNTQVKLMKFATGGTWANDNLTEFTE